MDSDDSFFPHKVETMVNYFLQVMPQTPDALIFHRVEMRTDDGSSPSLYRPRNLRTLEGKKKSGLLEKLSDPESAYRYIQKWGFLPFFNCSTSGLSLTRSLAARIFPLPEKMMRLQDTLLVFVSMLLGTVYGTSEVLGSYVLQGNNVSLNSSGFEGDDHHIKTMENFLNNFLEKMNKPGIISYYDSRYASQVLWKNQRAV